MAALTIRNLDEGLKKRLRVRAAIHGTSMEDEARSILRAALAEERATPEHLGTALHELFAPLGGVELDIPERQEMRGPPSFA
jgi:plasmid stability protein